MLGRDYSRAAKPAMLALPMARIPPRKHLDGSLCLEGTRKVPRSHHPCCEPFDSHTRSCTFDIRYEWWNSQRGWFLRIDDSAGGGGIAISFCPHCGSKLAGSGRSGRWFDVRAPAKSGSRRKRAVSARRRRTRS
jgi:hypothetical protein